MMNNLKITDEEYLSISESEFRARLRERLHHTLEIQTYACAYRKKSINPGQADAVKHILNLWEIRKLDKNLPEYVYAIKILGFFDDVLSDKGPDLSPYKRPFFGKEEQDVVMNVIKNRRSVREFKDIHVPDHIIDRILEAGLWAPHSCNLQSVNYIVIREKENPGLFKGSDVPAGPVHIVLLQDERVYLANKGIPEKNRSMDAGGAMQNILLAAFALGLDGVWLTFSLAMKERLREAYNIPEHFSIATYADIGYGDQTPFPPLRKSLEEATFAR